ncbi:MAG: hypothetical protein WCA46_27270 [Actinocatenispora sp.]
MIWLAWRQQRLQLIVSLSLVAALAAVVVGVHLDAVAYLHSHGITRCLSHATQACEPGMSMFRDRYDMVESTITSVLVGVPVVLGIFAGAPLFAREFEQRTHLFALTQSMSRTRWWITKLVVAGAPVVLGTALLGVLNAWAATPLDYFGGSRLGTPNFESQGLVLAAYALLAFTISAVAGQLSRNTVAAMAVGLALYVGIVVGVSQGARPHYQAPVALRAGVSDVTPSIPRGGTWVSMDYVNAAGARLDYTAMHCEGLDGTFEECLKQNDITSQVVEYQPATRFWPFQLAESGIVAVLSAALLGLGGVLLLRRLR